MKVVWHKYVDHNEVSEATLVVQLLISAMLSWTPFLKSLFCSHCIQVNFWVQKEILSGKTMKSRGEVLGHFIKIAKVEL